MRLSNILLGALIFGLIAPPLGSLVIMIPIAIAALTAGGSNIASAVLGGMIFSYLFGGVQAVIVGAIAGALRPCIAGPLGLTAVAILGVAVNAIAVLALLWSKPEQTSSMILLGGACALVGGWVTAWLFVRITPLYPADERSDLDVQRPSVTTDPA